jgi:transposase
MARKSNKQITGRRERQQARRMQAGQMFAAGKTRADVARELKVSWRAAHGWYQSWVGKGDSGLLAKGKPGPAPKFIEEDLGKIAACLAQGAMAHGYPNELWTIPRIARMIGEKFAVRASGSEVWRLLRRMGWSPQKPAKRARERNPEAIALWKKEKWPRILQQAQREGRTIVFVDESGLSMKPARKSTWAPAGQTPVLEFCFNWKKLSAIGGVSFRQIYFQLHEGSIKTEEIIAFLNHLCRHIHGQLLVVWDGLRGHWSRAVQEHIASLKGRVVLEQLPAYAPELNPVEYLWAQIKQHEMANFTAKDLAELSAMARKAIRKIRSAPRYVRAFWIQSELPFN